MKHLIGVLAGFLICVSGTHLYAADFLTLKEVKLGESVADFQLESPEGKTFQLSSQKGKNVLIIFWSAQCPFVVRYEQRLQDIVRDYEPKGVVAAAIDSNVNDSLDEVKKTAAERGLNYTVYMDPNNKIADRFGAITTPHVYLIDAEGRLAYEGAVDNQGWSESKKPDRHYVREALDALLAGRPVIDSKTRTAGCTIKRKSA